MPDFQICHLIFPQFKGRGYLNMSLGQIIKEKRRALGLTQLDLAEKIDVSILKLATWEADEELPTDEQFISLSKALECQIKDLTDKPIHVQE